MRVRYRIILITLIAPLIFASCKAVNAPVNTVKFGVKAPIDVVDKETALGTVISGETKDVKGFLKKVKETNQRLSEERERTRDSENIYEPFDRLDHR